MLTLFQLIQAMLWFACIKWMHCLAYIEINANAVLFVRMLCTFAWNLSIFSEYSALRICVVANSRGGRREIGRADATDWIYRATHCRFWRRKKIFIAIDRSAGQIHHVDWNFILVALLITVQKSFSFPNPFPFGWWVTEPNKVKLINTVSKCNNNICYIIE